MAQVGEDMSKCFNLVTLTCKDCHLEALSGCPEKPTMCTVQFTSSPRHKIFLHCPIGIIGGKRKGVEETRGRDRDHPDRKHRLTGAVPSRCLAELPGFPELHSQK